MIKSHKQACRLNNRCFLSTWAYLLLLALMLMVTVVIIAINDPVKLQHSSVIIFLHYQTNLEWLPSLHKCKSFLFKNLNEYGMQIRYSSCHYWQRDSSEFQLRERMERSWKSEERMKAQRQESMWQQQSERESSPAAQRGVSAKKTTFFWGGWRPHRVHLLFSYRSIIDK